MADGLTLPLTQLAAAFAVLALAHWVSRAWRRGTAFWGDDVPLLVSRLALGGLFVAAACFKIMDPGKFGESIHNFHIVPDRVALFMAVVLPYVELLAGCALLLGLRGRAGALVTSGLLVVFTVAVLAAIARGIDVECGCMGKYDAARTNWTKVVENGALLLIALHVLVLGPGRLALGEFLARLKAPSSAVRPDPAAEPAD